MQWRKTLFVLHRDVGFMALGLTLVYGISGIAVNHRRDWDFNRSVAVEALALGRATEVLGGLPADRLDALGRNPADVTPDEQRRLVQGLSAKLGKPQGPRNAFWRGPDKLSLFFGAGDDDTVDYSPSTGAAQRTVRRDRFLLRQLNSLHLNESGKLWTWLADLYAAGLLFLGITGVVMAKGRHGLRGRGGLLLAAGIVIPLVVWFLVRR